VKLKTLVFSLSFFAAPVFASPWVEADDAYLRSNIQLLADAGVLSAPVNSYPLPWALIADDIKKIKPTKLPRYLQVSYYHLRFQLQRAEGKRFHARVKIGGESSGSQAAFGDTNHAKWGAMGSVEYVSDYFALRANTGFNEMHGDKAKFIDDGSYFAINYKAMSLNVGRLERWWGNSWQSTLSEGQNARPMPAIALSYADVKVPILNSVFAETFVAIVDGNSAYSQKWANRLSVKPVKRLELSVNYTLLWELKDSWATRFDSTDEQRHQVGLGTRISLPAVSDFQPGLYAQWQHDSVKSLQNSFIVGLDFAGDILDQQVRFVAEYKNSHKGNQQWIDWLSSIDQAGNESVLTGDTISVGAYMQFSDDQKLDLFIHHEQMDTDAVRVSVNYSVPALKGRLKLALNYTNASWENEQIQAGISWEYRF